MKKLILLLVLLGFSKILGQSENSFIYTNQEVTIELKINGGKTALQHRKKNNITIHSKNIDPRVLTCSGPGLRIIKGATDGNLNSAWEIDLIDAEMAKTYIFRFSYKKKDTFFTGKFEIPIE